MLSNRFGKLIDRQPHRSCERVRPALELVPVPCRAQVAGGFLSDPLPTARVVAYREELFAERFGLRHPREPVEQALQPHGILRIPLVARLVEILDLAELLAAKHDVGCEAAVAHGLHLQQRLLFWRGAGRYAKPLHDRLDVAGASGDVREDAPVKERLHQVVVIPRVEVEVAGDGPHVGTGVRGEDRGPRHRRADAVVEVQGCKVGRCVGEGHRKNLLGPQGHPAVENFPAPFDDELIRHVPEEHAVAEEPVARLDCKRDAGASRLRKEVEPAIARIVPRQLQTDLAMERHADLLLPPPGKLLQPLFIVAEDVVLKVHQLQRPALLYRAGLFDKVRNGAHAKLKATVHFVERRSVTISARHGAPDRAEDALDGACSQLRIRVVNGGAVRRRERFRTSGAVKVHRLRQSFLQDVPQDAKAAALDHPVGVFFALRRKVRRVGAADDNRHSHRAHRVARIERLFVVARPDLEPDYAGLPLADGFVDRLKIELAREHDLAFPAGLADKAREVEDAQRLDTIVPSAE